eukprot:1876520-Amphidinium_carterae.1
MFQTSSAAHSGTKDRLRRSDLNIGSPNLDSKQCNMIPIKGCKSQHCKHDKPSKKQLKLCKSLKYMVNASNTVCGIWALRVAVTSRRYLLVVAFPVKGAWLNT